MQPGSSVTIGVPCETALGEGRVAVIPETVGKLAALGIEVVLETGAGARAHFTDAEYVEAGAAVVPRPADAYEAATIVARVRAPSVEEARQMRRGSAMISFLDPARNEDLLRALDEREIAAFSFNRLPRTTLAQSMDAMSSMATVAGYKAVLLAAGALGRFFPLLMTAAGTVPPARLLVLGAGVAGLQALATGRRLGAVTSAFDTRPVVREHVQSVGATFIEMPEVAEEPEVEGGYAREMGAEFYARERDAIRDHVARSDVIITTAAIPGKRAPVLIDDDMVASMPSGSVIVDLAAETGGNCTATVAGETVTCGDVTVMGPLDVPSTVPTHASQLYSRNVLNVIKHITKDGALALDFHDEIMLAAFVTGARVTP